MMSSCDWHMDRNGAIKRLSVRDGLAEVMTATPCEESLVRFERRIFPASPDQSVSDLFAEAGHQVGVVVGFSEGVRAFELETSSGHARSKKIADRLDLAALQALSCVDVYEHVQYEFYAGPGEKAEIRRQAAAAYPMFAGLVASSFLLRLAVDRRASLAGALLRVFGDDEGGRPRMTKSHLKRFAGRKVSAEGLDVMQVAAFAARLPVEWFPATQAEWGAFLAVVEGVDNRIAPLAPVDVVGFLSTSKGKWVDFVERICRASADRRADEDGVVRWEERFTPSRQAFVLACSGLADMTLAFRDGVLLPALGQAAIDRKPYMSTEWASQAATLAYRLLFDGVTPVKAVQAQRLWHTQSDAIEDTRTAMTMAASVVEVGSNGWPPLCDEVQAPNGIVIRPLIEPRELAEEGQRMNHCIRTRVSACRNGAHVLSMRVPDALGGTRSLSTIEYNASETFEIREPREHRGHSNATPSADCLAAQAWFEHSIATGEIPLNRDGAMEFTANRRRQSEEIEAYCDYNWRDIENLKMIYDAWTPYLPLSLPVDVQAFVASEEVADLAEMMAPSFGRFEAELVKPSVSVPLA